MIAHLLQRRMKVLKFFEKSKSATRIRLETSINHRMEISTWIVWRGRTLTRDTNEI
jgi:hypothetical protein